MLLSALSLLAIQQLQGCSSLLVAMPAEQVFDVPTLFVTVWISFLGVYVLWQSRRKPKLGTMDDKSNDSVLNETSSADEASEQGFNNDGETGSESSFDD